MGCCAIFSLLLYICLVVAGIVGICLSAYFPLWWVINGQGLGIFYGCVNVTNMAVLQQGNNVFSSCMQWLYSGNLPQYHQIIWLLLAVSLLLHLLCLIWSVLSMLEVCCAVCCRRSFLVGMPIFSAINAECMGAIAILFGINYYDDPHFAQYRGSISYGICFWIIIAVGVVDIFSFIFGAVVFKCTKDEKD